MSPRLRGAALAALAAAGHLGGLVGPFQFDDYNVIVGQGNVHGLGAWAASLPGLRPLLKLSYALNWSLGSGPFGFHLVNLAVHAANAVLAWRLLRRGLGPDREPLAWAAAALFALHPAQTEAVAYICGRSESLMALFGMGGCLAFLAAWDRGGGIRRELPGAGLLVLACLVKETAVALPVVLLLVARVRPGPRPRLLVPVLAVAAAAFLVEGLPRLLAHGYRVRDLRGLAPSQVHGVAHLLKVFLGLAPLNADPHLAWQAGWTWPVAFEAAGLLALAGLGLAWLQRRPAAGLGLLGCLILLVPAHCLVPRLDLANDRHLYLPSLGLWLAAADLGWAWAGPRLVWALAALGMLLGLGTWRRDRDYRSERALWEASLRVDPGNPRAQVNLGWALVLEGDRTGARARFQEALRLDPGHRTARADLAWLDREAAAGR